MFRYFILFAVFGATCYGAPQNNPQRICYEIPAHLIGCLNVPQIVSNSVSDACKNDNLCDKMTCVFRKSKWLKDNAVDKAKLTSFLDQYAKDHPLWADEVQLAKTACLSSDLPPQGVYLNCPTYDVAHCIFKTFIKHATPSQWSSKPECGGPHWYADSCPVCPSDCFAPQIPIGSCNACLVPL